MTATTDQAEDLAARIERLIAAEMNPATGSGMTLLDATVKVATDARAEAREKGWEPHQVRALGIFTVKVGAAIGRRAEEQGIVTREEPPAAPPAPQEDTVISLPEPTDIQVATGVPKVAAYRAATIAAGKAAFKAKTQREYLDETRRRVPDTTAKHRDIRDRAYRRYRDAAAEHDTAVNAMSAALAAAHAVAPAATQRAQLTVDAYSVRLHTELQADRQRHGLD